MRTTLFILLLTIVVRVPFALATEKRKSTSQYIDEFKEEAVNGMLKDGVPASITLAQGIQESSSGNSPLAIGANNHFGIKCQREWVGPTYIQDDDAKNECFRKYESAYESYLDHADFLRTRSRYAFLFQLSVTDYKGWAKGLKAAGYATDPNYANKLIKIIETYKLHYLDTITRPIPELIASIDNYFGSTEKHYSSQKHTSHNEKSELESTKRTIQLKNERKFIIARAGETVDEISTEYDTDPRLIAKYNELDKKNTTRFKAGEIIFLQPKRNKAKDEFHVVKKGETMYGISQQHGIKLKQLYKKNKMLPGAEPSAGEKLWLRKTKSS